LMKKGKGPDGAIDQGEGGGKEPTLLRGGKGKVAGSVGKTFSPMEGGKGVREKRIFQMKREGLAK